MDHGGAQFRYVLRLISAFAAGCAEREQVTRVKAPCLPYRFWKLPQAGCAGLTSGRRRSEAGPAPRVEALQLQDLNPALGQAEALFIREYTGSRQEGTVMSFVTFRNCRRLWRTVLAAPLAALILVAPTTGSAEEQNAGADGAALGANADGAAVGGDAGDVRRTPGLSLLDIPVHGFLSIKYRSRWTDKATKDNDAFANLGLDFGDPAKNRVTGHFLARGASDFDGKKDQQGSFAYDSIEDTYSSNVTGRLYHAYFDLHDVELFDTIRLGRQSIYDTPEVAYFDGARLETEETGPFRLRLGAYGGVSVNRFESSRDDDLLFGGFLQARPWRGGKLRADLMHSQDDKRFTGTERQDELYTFSVWQGFTQYARFHANYGYLEGKNRDVLGRVDVQVPEWDLRAQVSYYQIFNTQHEYSLEFDPLYTSNIELSPYHQVTWLASKGIGDHFVVEGGSDVRRLKHDHDFAMYNREFDRFYLTLSSIDLPAEGLSLSLTGEIWDSPGQHINSFGADVTHQCSDQLTSSVGTYYSLFKYDFLDIQERDDVQTYYLKAVYKFTDRLKGDIRYEFEDDEFDEYHQVRVGLLWSF